MRRTISFKYSATRTCHAYLSFFSELASRYSLTLKESGTECHQFVSRDKLEEVGRRLKIEAHSADASHCWQPLSEECVALLTRVVTYGKRVYQSASFDAEIQIMFSDQNNFPAIGIDIWTSGCSALPGGFFIAVAPDATMVTQLIDAVNEFKNGVSE